ncbi:MAG: hypothetical protein DRI54_05115 [Bacteroidetes bacterium]|nr:MAG: hypothetical protein DRI54_05115 [Bacteroidota bacterium]
MTKLYYFIVLLFISVSANAQYNWEIGGGLGVSNYLGDIGGGAGEAKNSVADLKMNQSKLSVTAFSRYRFSHRIALGAFLTYGRIAGEDANSENRSRRGRNLSFRNDLFELAIRADVALYTNYDVGRKGYYNPDFKLYLFLGVAGLYSNPQANALSDGEWHNLRELKTEGQFDPYSQIVFAIPGGLGFFFTYDRVNRFGFEAQYTLPFSDYLDDVSTVYADPAILPNDLSIELANRRPELDESEDVPAPQNYTAGNKRGNPDNIDSYMFLRVYYSRVLRGKSGYYKRGQYNFLHRKNRKRRKSRAKF